MLDACGVCGWRFIVDVRIVLGRADFTAGRLTQTIGNATASAGTHGQDGVAAGRPYSAATDLSVELGALPDREPGRELT